MAIKIQTVKRVKKEELAILIRKYSPVYLYDEDINNMVERLSLHTLMVIVEAFRYSYLLRHLTDKYAIVNKLFFKIAKNE